MAFIKRAVGRVCPFAKAAASLTNAGAHCLSLHAAVSSSSLARPPLVPPSRRVVNVVVLGGGVAGLAAAWMLRHAAGCLAHPLPVPSSSPSPVPLPLFRPLLRVTVVERSPRVGGWLKSSREGRATGEAEGSGMLFERGCRGIRPAGPSGRDSLRLVEALGLQHRTLLAAETSRRRFVWLQRTARPEPVPANLVAALLTSPLTRGLARLPRWLLHDILAPVRSADSGALAKPGTLADADVAEAARLDDGSAEALSERDDESLAAFATRRFGADSRPDLSETLLDAVMSGIYAGDVTRLSARSVARFLWEAEGRGGVVAGMAARMRVPAPLPRSAFDFASAFGASADRAASAHGAEHEDSAFVAACLRASSVSFTDGMQALPEALAHSLRSGEALTQLRGQGSAAFDVEVRLLRSTEAVALASTEGGVNVELRSDEGAESVRADAVISTLPPAALADLLAPPSEAARDGASAALGLSPLGRAVAALRAVPMASVAVVSFGWRADRGGAALPAHLRGFGYLVPSNARGPPPVAAAPAQGEEEARVCVLGATFDSEAFPGQADAFAAPRRAWRAAPGASVLPCSEAMLPSPLAHRGEGVAAPPSSLSSPPALAPAAGELRISVLMGGAHWPAVAAAPAALHERLARRALREHLGLGIGLGSGAADTMAALSSAGTLAPLREPDAIVHSVGAACIPQYTIGHAHRAGAARRGLAQAFGGRLTIAGNGLGGVGVADAIAGALAQARATLRAVGLEPAAE